MQDEHPPAGQGRAKLCLRQATACDPAFRSGHFRLKVSLLSGSHEQNITFATKMSCSTANFSKGSPDSSPAKLRTLLPGSGPAVPHRDHAFRGDLASRHGSIVRIATAHSWSYRSADPICTRTPSIVLVVIGRRLFGHGMNEERLRDPRCRTVRGSRRTGCAIALLRVRRRTVS